MGSTRVSVGLCIVMLVGVVAALPAAVTAQQGPVVITATIVDQEGQSVGGGVDVTATWDGGSANVTTLSDGQVRFEAPRGANVSVSVNDDQFIRNNPYVISNATDESVEVPVSESGTATITVQNTANETVENAQVVLFRGSDGEVTDQRTGADGTVTTPAVEQGEYSLYIFKSGYLNNRTRVTVGEQTDINRTIQQDEVFLTVEVVDDYFSPPESLDASVEIPGAGTLTTGSDGDATTSVPVNTNYDVVVTTDGYDRATETVEVNQQDTTATVSIDRTDNLTISTRDRVLLGNPITLEVTDEYGDPVSGATVSQGGQQVGTTDADGEFETDTESAGPVNFTVDDGEVQQEATVEVVEASAELTGTPIATSTPTPTPTATDTGPTETAGGNGPGFTPVTVVAALALLSLVAYRRR